MKMTGVRLRGRGDPVSNHVLRLGFVSRYEVLAGPATENNQSCKRD
jgi:hypothetical protein